MSKKVLVNIYPVSVNKFLGYKLPAFNVLLDEEMYNIIMTSSTKQQIAVVLVKDNIPNPIITGPNPALEGRHTPQVQDDEAEVKSEPSSPEVKKDSSVAPLPTHTQEIRNRYGGPMRRVPRSSSGSTPKNYMLPVYDLDDLLNNYSKEDMEQILIRRGHNESSTHGASDDPYSPKIRDNKTILASKIIATNKKP
jgi:hypothetical protein